MFCERRGGGRGRNWRVKKKNNPAEIFKAKGGHCNFVSEPSRDPLSFPR